MINRRIGQARENQWGGERAGAGRPVTATTLGKRRAPGQHAITSFFATPITITPTVEMEDITMPPPIHDNEEEGKEENSDATSTSEDELGGEEEEIAHDEKKKKFSGLLRETINSLTKIDGGHKVKQGILWTQTKKDYVRPTSISHQQLGESWKLFCSLDIFHWRPDLMIQGWKPDCITCGQNNNVRTNAWNREPRLVYGVKKNYLLDSPVQWYCLHCQKANATSPKKIQHMFMSHHVKVLDQLRLRHPGIHALFPCEMGWRSAIDNELIELLFAAADSGMGPSSVQGFVETMHHQHHHKAELQWLQFLLLRQGQPLPVDASLDDIIKSLSSFPAYTSEAVCGMVPSQSLLCDVYCKATMERTKRMDALHQRLIRHSLKFCLDASYKVPKWLANFLGMPMYSTLITMINEYSEPLASYFALSDNHGEIKSCLDMLRESGFEAEVAFTDNVPRDDMFLQSCLPSLKSSTSVTTGKNNASGLPLLQLRAEPEYLSKSEEAIAALDLFEDRISNSQAEQPVVLSFDLEWSTQPGAPRGQVAVFSLASLAYETCLVIHLAKIGHKNELLNRISQLFGNRKYLFVGSNIKNDLTIFQKDFPTAKFRVPKSQDLGMMAVYRGLVPFTKGSYGLKPLCMKVLGQRIPEDDQANNSIRMSDIWNRPGKLSKDGITYAARDVEAAVRIYEEIKAMPDLSTRLGKKDLEAGLEVDVLPRRKTVVQPIATGRILQLEGSTITGIQLGKSKRVLVAISQVFKPESGLIYTQVGRTKCKCGAESHKRGNSYHCDLRTFRDASKLGGELIVVEEYSRLRKRQLAPEDIGEEAIEKEAPTTTEDPILLPVLETITEQEEQASRRLAGAIELEEEEDDDDALDVDLDIPNETVQQIDNLLENLEDAPDENGDTADDGGSVGSLHHSPINFPLANATSNQVAIQLEGRALVERLIADADMLAEHDSEELAQTHVMEGSDDREERENIRRVLGDAFHIMDRVKVPIHHDWKAAYFAGLRDAIFIWDWSDKQDVQAILRKKGKKWDNEVAFNLLYIVLRVRRKIPPAKILHARVKAVFDYFKNQKDSKTSKPLFGERATEMAQKVLEAISRGEISDPPGIAMYVPIFDGEEPKKDKDGLQLWKCLRGTGPAESAHSQYTRSFGQVRAGPMYSCCVLRNHHHRKSWRASAANRPGFPKIKHYDTGLVDSINVLSRQLFEKSKFEGWPDYDEAVPVKRSPFGIIPLLEDCGRPRGAKANQFLTPQQRFLATMMSSDLPYTPIATKEERILFKNLLEKWLREGRAINQDTFYQLCLQWNTAHVCVPTKELPEISVYPKYVAHLVSHYKRWRISNKKRSAIEEARRDPAIKALSRNKGIRVTDPPLKRQALVAAAPPAPSPAPQSPPPAPRANAQSPSPRLLPTLPPPPLPLLPLPHTQYYFPFPKYRQPPPERQQRQQQKKRKTKTCQFCFNGKCQRPWNRRGVCNS